MNMKEGELLFEEKETKLEDEYGKIKEEISVEAEKIVIEQEIPTEVINERIEEERQESSHDSQIFHNEEMIQAEMKENQINSIKLPNENDNSRENNNIPTQKTIHQKIFLTTQMERKKNVNFKVIKNREKEINNFHININENFEKNNKINNKNNNDYISEELNSERMSDKIFQNNIVNTENKRENVPMRDSFYKTTTNNKYNNNQNSFNNPINIFGMNPNHNWNMKFQSNHSSFQINKQPQFQFYNANISGVVPMCMSPKKKLKHKETYHYIDILLNAADKIIKEGYCTIEHISATSSSEMTEEINHNNHHRQIKKEENSNLIEEKIIEEQKEIEEDCPKINSNKNSHISESDCSNSVSKIKTNPNGKCENKNCDSHSVYSTRKKIKITKIKNCKGKIIRLCQKCVKCWNNGQYCYYCLSIYSDQDSNSCVDDKEWIQCDTCNSWHHLQCEEKKGHFYTHLHKLLNDDTFKYFCANCREKKNNNQKNNFLKKKRAQTNNQNYYIKEYNITFKTTSRRMKEKKLKMMEKNIDKISNSPQSERKIRKKSSNNFLDCYEYTQVKRKKGTTDKVNHGVTKNLNFLNYNENSREIIQDIHKINDKVNNLIK